MRGWKSLAVFFLLVAAAAGAGAMAAPDTWYAALTKPAFNPPAWLFGPVWTLLYVFMAIAAWRVYRRQGVDLSIGAWLVQLVVNAAWSPLFFGAHRIDLALIDILVLDLVVIVTIALFFRRDRISGWLMLPYLAWIGFATVLNASLWTLNPG
ncbi:TspO/MBR family protein [Dokdonella immobilis]|uniref:TspO and MBR related proteins n=1 Tax=Dokdonella immobilis TaxID=578942 RepID=A0A1I4VIB3_9GAMM|nr:TspO/MBR family protein [Dokdonella immobilis]SFN00994.1 TspO and MBR related proteins [Dokdonella immobilis]